MINLKQRFFLKWHMQILAVIKRMIYKYILGRKQTVIFVERKREEEYLIFSRLIQKFIDKHINSYNVKSYNCIKKEYFDLIVVGSDQIWRPRFNNKIEDAYLAFAEKWELKRIAYAASFGTDIWEYSDAQTKRCYNLIKLFDNVSVREKSGIKLCKEHFCIHVDHVLDPSMLLKKDDYLYLLNKKNDETKHKYIMKYLLDETAVQKQIIDNISKAHGFEIKYFLTDFSVVPNHEKTMKKDSVESWLEGILYSDFVITDSFHACVFSIIFQKEFFVFFNSTRGNTRILSLIQQLGLIDRVISDDEQFEISEMKRIDYSIVQKRLDQLRIESMKFLSSSIN